jgi:hypothetical protein
MKLVMNLKMEGYAVARIIAFSLTVGVLLNSLWRNARERERSEPGAGGRKANRCTGLRRLRAAAPTSVRGGRSD